MNRKPRARPAQLRARTVARKTSRPDTSGAKVLGSKTSRQAMPRSKVARGSKRPKSAREKVKAYRERMRRRGMKLIQIWVPDPSSPYFAAQARRESRSITESLQEKDDQAFIDSIADWDG